jgi:uncharacterized membrane protein
MQFGKPRIKPVKSKAQVFVEILTFILVMATFAMIAINYVSLPDRIPIHFNWPGKDAEGFGSKSYLWYTPITVAIIVALLSFVNRFPWWMNYPLQITEENAEIQYELSTQMIRMLTFAVAIVGLFVTSASIFEGLGYNVAWAKAFSPLLPLFFFGIPVFYFIKLFRAR